MRRLLGWLRVALIDLRGSAQRFVILIACLALGVAAIGTVSSVRSSVEAAIARDARAILGGDLELRAQRADIDDDVREALAGLGTVSRQVEINAQAAFGDQSVLLGLRAVTPAYPLVGAVALAPGAMDGRAADLLAQQDGDFGVLLSQQAALRLGASVGDLIRIGTADFQLRGIIVALPDQAAAGFQLGAPALVADTALAPAGLRAEGILSQFRYKVLLDGVDFEQASTQLESQFPERDWQVRSPRQATAAITRFIDIFGNFMLLVALSSMLVGGLGAANAVSAYVGQRQAAIATMRALGASGLRIMVHFLVQITVLALVGIVIGLVIVGVATLTLLPLLSGLVSLDLGASLDARSMLVAGAIGLATALIFSFVPLLQAAAIRPASLFRGGASGMALGGLKGLLSWRVVLALAAGLAVLFGLTLLLANDLRLVGVYFIAAMLAFGLLRLAALVLIGLLRRLPAARHRLLRQAVSAIIRPGAPTTTVLVSLGMGLALMLLIVTTQSNINSQIASEVSANAPDFVALDINRDTLGTLEAFTASNPAIADLTSIPMLRGTIVALGGEAAPSSEDVPEDVADLFRGDTSLTWSAKLPDEAVLAEGEWWAEDYAGPPLVSLVTDLRDALDLAVGDTFTMTIAGRPLEMTIASFRAVDQRSPEFNFRIIVSPGMIEGAPQSYFATIKAVPDARQAVEADLIRTLPGLSFVSVGDALAQVQTVFDGLTNAIALVSGTAVFAGIFVLAGTLSVGRKQREAEAIVLKVLGARRFDVIAAFLVEYALLGVIATVMALAIALAGSWAASTLLLDIGFAVQPWPLLVLATIIVMVTTATGAASTWSSMSVRPADRLREET